MRALFAAAAASSLLGNAVGCTSGLTDDGSVHGKQAVWTRIVGDNRRLRGLREILLDPARAWG